MCCTIEIYLHGHVKVGQLSILSFDKHFFWSINQKHQTVSSCDFVISCQRFYLESVLGQDILTCQHKNAKIPLVLTMSESISKLLRYLIMWLVLNCMYSEMSYVVTILLFI